MDERMIQLVNSGLSLEELLNAKATMNGDMLSSIALNTASQDSLNSLLSEDTMTQIKVFLIAQAKAELVRVMKLTDTLNKLEDKYMTRALDDADGMDMKSLAITMNVITQSLQRSMDLINRVTQDQNLQIIIDQSTNILNNNTAPTINVIENKESREKIRTIASQLLGILQSPKEDVYVAPPVVVSDEEEDSDDE